MLKKKHLSVLLKGMAMGAADVVPGVSGGTIAFISGIYETFIQGLKSLNAHHFKLLFSGDSRAFWKGINGSFLLPLFLGIGVSILSLSGLIKQLLDTEPVLLWSFFFGLILASLFFICKALGKLRAGSWIAIGVGAAAAYLISTAHPIERPEGYLLLLFSGFLAICAMMLPGISGAFILLLLGSYQGLMSTLNQFASGLIASDAAALIASGSRLATFAIGALLGLAVFSRVLSWLLERCGALTLALLTGFMLGSLNKVWPWKETLSTRLNAYGKWVPLLQRNVSPLHYSGGSPQIALALALATAGFLLIFILEKYASQRDA